MNFILPQRFTEVFTELHRVFFNFVIPLCSSVSSVVKFIILGYHNRYNQQITQIMIFINFICVTLRNL